MRLFVAIVLSDRVRKNLADLQRVLGRTCPGVRWILPELLHLTVKFLGEVPDSQVPAVCEAIEKGAAPLEPFEMNVEGCGCFPPRGPVRIVWAGASAAEGTLQRCAESVTSELSRAGFAGDEKPFSPHITIGRVREDSSGGKLRSAVSSASFASVDQRVESISLMSSVLSPKGPAYTRVGRSKLQNITHSVGGEGVG